MTIPKESKPIKTAPSQPNTIGRRQFMKFSAASTAAVATVGLPLLHFRQAQASVAGIDGARSQPMLGSWDDLYRQRWTWDSVSKGSHGWANCRSACEWDLFVKDGIVVREEQSAEYEQSEAGVPDFNPRGCQKGACYTEVMYGPSRITVPLKRVGPRGSGKWQKVSWEAAIDDIATRMVDLAAEYGPSTIMQDLGPNFDNGATTVGRFKFQMKAGGTFADMWAEIGDLCVGTALTVGFAHTGGTSDEWFLSDYIVVWMMNPSVTQISDAHFLYEAKYNGSELVVVDPQYSATSIHADQWLPLRSGTDAALALATARHIIDSERVDWAYVKEQTDLPLLVRMDNGEFLRGSHLEKNGDRLQLYMWDPKTAAVWAAPACEGGDNPKLTLAIDPAVEGHFTVRLHDGEEVVVAPVAALIKEQVEPFTLAATAEITGLAEEQIFAFADGFAKAERPLVLSSWGSNRYVHSDLMNRAKMLCLALRGAIGKRGAGIHTGGFIDMGGLGSQLQSEHEGLYGKLAMIAGVLEPSDLYNLVVDIVKGRKAPEMYAKDMAAAGEKKIVCRSTMAQEFYNHQGIKETLDAEVAKFDERPLEDYHREAGEKGWKEEMDGPPKIFITGGSNLLRRSNQGGKMLDTFWPKIDLVIAVEKRMSFTAMHADYVLPGAGWYEKPGIKYTMSYTPYMHYCDAAVPPLGESKDEWEIYWLLTERIQQIARERDLAPMNACGKFDVDWKKLHEQYTSHGAFGQKDAEKVTQAILDDSPNLNGVKIADLKKKGIEKFSGTGENIMPTNQYNPDWKGEGVLTSMTLFTEHKYRWPTYTGRIQFYIDHPWFIEARETLPAHKESPKAGGDYPFQMVSCHSRWSIHSTWRDVPMLLRMQRGEPVMYLNSVEAQQLGLEDGAYAEFFNDLGSILMRLKYSSMVRPGVAYYFHAWEPNQFPNHQSYKWLIPGVPKPLHMAGGDGHLHFGINHLQLGAYVQDTRVGIRAVEQSKVEELMASAADSSKKGKG
jgi:DMSO reductase family type II enzyme molybdopterin subunit